MQPVVAGQEVDKPVGWPGRGQDLGTRFLTGDRQAGAVHQATLDENAHLTPVAPLHRDLIPPGPGDFTAGRLARTAKPNSTGTFHPDGPAARLWSILRTRP